MVAERRPEHGLAQQGGVHLEMLGLVLRVGAGALGDVSDMQPEVGACAACIGNNFAVYELRVSLTRF